MELKEALTLRKPEYVKQEKNKSGVMTLGSPGNYKYYYKDEAGKLLAPGAKEQVSGRIMRQKEKKPVSSKKYMKEHAGDIREEADELKRMGEEDFKRKKAEYDKKKGLTAGQKVNIALKKWQQSKKDKKKAMVTVGGDTVGAARREKQAKASYEIAVDTFKRKEGKKKRGTDELSEKRLKTMSKEDYKLWLRNVQKKKKKEKE